MAHPRLALPGNRDDIAPASGPAWSWAVTLPNLPPRPHCSEGHACLLEPACLRHRTVGLRQPASRTATAAGGDSTIQLRHRAAFLDAGHYDALGAMIARHMKHGTAPTNHRWCVLDAGCGTGHHLDRNRAGLTRRVVGLGLDISSEAGRYAARRWPGLAWHLPLLICGVNGLSEMLRPILLSARWHRRTSPRPHACSARVDGSPWRIPARNILWS
jgi:hypothetical protein